MDNLLFYLLKAQLNIYFLFWNINLFHGLCFAAIVPVSKIEIIKKSAHLNCAMGAILPRYAKALNIIVCRADTGNSLFIGGWSIGKFVVVYAAWR